MQGQLHYVCYPLQITFRVISVPLQLVQPSVNQQGPLVAAAILNSQNQKNQLQNLLQPRATLSSSTHPQLTAQQNKAQKLGHLIVDAFDDASQALPLGQGGFIHSLQGL